MYFLLLHCVSFSDVIDTCHLKEKKYRTSRGLTTSMPLKSHTHLTTYTIQGLLETYYQQELPDCLSNEGTPPAKAFIFCSCDLDLDPMTLTCLSVSCQFAVSPLSFIFLLKNDALFSLLFISLGCQTVTPMEGAPHTFLPVRPRLSTILCKFSHNIFSFGCHPLEGVTRGGPFPLRPLLTPLYAN